MTRSFVDAYTVLGVATWAAESDVRDAYGELIVAWATAATPDAADERALVEAAFEAIRAAGFPPDPDARPTAPAPLAEGEVGPYVDMMAMMLPAYVRHGHGILVLRDLSVRELVIDGTSVGDPTASRHPLVTNFRGFFNVPFGRHTLVARALGQESTCMVDVEINGAHVKRLDWNAGGWVDDPPDVDAQYRELARSGSMFQAKALRPWPRASLFIQGAPPDLRMNGVAVAGPALMCGVLNLAPGRYTVTSPSAGYAESMTLPPEGLQLIQFDEASGSVVPGQLAEMMVKTALPRSPEGALMLAETLNLKPA